MEENNNNYVLEIQDPLNQEKYELILSEEDFQKAHSDENFANSLLFHARVISKTKAKSTSNMNPQTNNSASSSTIIGETSKTSIWGYNQTLALISSMTTHYNDLNDVKKRRHVFDHICNDLVSNGFEVNSLMVQNKWKSLIRSYKKAKDNKNRTGQGPTRFLFFEVMDDLLGQAPSNSCNHSINSMMNNSSTENVQSDPVLFEVAENNTDEVTADASEEDIGEREPINKENRNNEGNKRRRLSEKKIRSQYIDLKLKEYERRKKRHDEKMEVERQKIDIEKRKLAVLEDYLNYRKN